MSNEFEIAYWIAQHKRVLDLAINIRKGIMTSTDEEYEMASTSSSSSLQQCSLEPILTPPVIEQVNVQ